MTFSLSRVRTEQLCKCCESAGVTGVRGTVQVLGEQYRGEWPGLSCRFVVRSQAELFALTRSAGAPVYDLLFHSPLNVISPPFALAPSFRVAAIKAAHRAR